MVHGPNRGMGLDGPPNSELRKVGQNIDVGVQRQAFPARGRAIGFDLFTLHGQEEMGGQDLSRERVLPEFVLEGGGEDVR